MEAAHDGGPVCDGGGVVEGVDGAAEPQNELLEIAVCDGVGQGELGIDLIAEGLEALAAFEDVLGQGSGFEGDGANEGVVDCSHGVAH
jgi:hypothetical protein